MDPDANLAELLELARNVEDNESDVDDMSNDELRRIADDAQRLSELVCALDGWLRQGGFKPERWADK